MTGDASYRVEISGSDPYERTIEVNPFESAYSGSLGGQIRGLASLAVQIPDSEVSEMIFWGSGASIKYGTADEVIGKISLAKPGAVNDIAPMVYGGKRMLVYGTERGLGVAGPNDAGTGFADYSTRGAWRSAPDGVTSLDLSDDNSSIVFTTADGFVQQIAPADLIGGESCSGIIASEVVAQDSSSSLLPVRTQAGSNHVFVLSKPSSAAAVAPTFEQAYHPIFEAMLTDGVYSRLRAYPTGGGSPSLPGFATNDSSFERFDRFIPTDIAWDGQSLYVVGIAYDQQAVSDFLLQECSTSVDQPQQLKCMADAAKDGSLATFGLDSESGLLRFIGGFFVYRDMGNLSKADHFKQIQLTGLKYQEGAPPYIFAIAVQSERAFVRGPNFLLSIGRAESESAEENWDIDLKADLDEELVAALPNRVAPYQGGAAATFTALKASDGSGASALEIMGSDGDFGTLDTGAIYVRADGAGQSSGLIAAIEMESDRGGKLFLENATSKYAIDTNLSNGYVSNAAYDGTTLAFASSQRGTQTMPEYTFGWNVMVQSGIKISTRGTLFISRALGANQEFTGFPTLVSTDTDPNQKRGVAGIGLAADSSAVAVLYKGYAGGTWYHQIFLYGLSKTGDTFNSPSFLAKTNLLTATAPATANEGAVLSVKKSGANYEVLFSTPKNIYKWLSSSAAPTSLYSSDTLVDAALDASGTDKIAIVAGFKAMVKSLSSMSAAGASVQIEPKEGTSMTSLYGAEVALSGGTLALVTPYGAKDTFSVFEVSSSALTPAAATDLSDFLDVKLFSLFPGYLLASSPSSGIEIFSISGE